MVLELDKRDWKEREGAVGSCSMDCFIDLSGGFLSNSALISSDNNSFVGSESADGFQGQQAGGRPAMMPIGACCDSLEFACIQEPFLVPALLVGHMRTRGKRRRSAMDGYVRLKHRSRPREDVNMYVRDTLGNAACIQTSSVSCQDEEFSPITIEPSLASPAP
ncbi:hypothetical protein EVG20_g10723 [Dentipellis fragilis]|uniref:Uncharacterized protein n=1 Tax=Dentipellis fragilis TaxID=205917 RepID=A0A4Y9XSA4_9AGAM|nr:hypothetical protein EVG20_g10723 [Dentipellis fragilis]